ncbi:SLC13 family permease [Peribacillus frigoritolerans]|uniref:SLC13 family permease n=1 Tax=Peribacillus frigoritolerans TaxID=450367 RepID=UPI0021AABF5C|nr:SLC13 family permease [Peribacillus frigoritolerans]MCT4477292.1 SLC13 family permease [Peribacillus frigoritolerans]
MSLELITIFVLLAMFIIGSVISVNMGILGMVAAFVVGTYVSGLAVEDIYAAFPIDMFILLTGVTYLFAIALNNGTLDLIISGGLKLVKGNVGLLPWVLFSLAALLSAVGASTVAVGPILFPIALRLAHQHKINPILMGTLISTGMYAGSFSPLNIFGLVVNGIMHSEKIPHSPIMLFINSFIFYVLISIVIFIAFGGLRLLKHTTSAQLEIAATTEGNAGSIPNEKEDHATLWYQVATLFGIGLLITMALAFEMNMGFGALMIGLALGFMAPSKQTQIIKQMPWAVMIMVTGIMTYVGVMEKVGTMDYMTEQIASVGNPVLASLMASYVGGIISAFASTTGFLAAVIPLSAPILQDPTMSSIGVVSALAVAASVVDISPFSTNGALIMANVQGVNERLFFKKLLMIAGLFIAIGPGLAWLIFVVIGTPW